VLGIHGVAKSIGSAAKLKGFQDFR
jgi:hypothetical protein